MEQFRTGYRLKICVVGLANSPHEYNWSRALAEEGHEVMLLSPKDRPNATLPLQVVEPVTVGPRPLRRLFTFVRWILACRKLDADVYHAHYASDYGPWALALTGRKPLAVTAMGSDVLHAAKNDFGRTTGFLTRIVLRRTNLLISHSRHVADIATSHGAQAASVMLSLWGVDLNQFKHDPEGRRRLREIWNIPNDAFVLFSPRGFNSIYRTDQIIDAVAQAGEQVILVMTETSTNMTAVAEARSRMQRQNIDFRLIDPVPHDAMPAHYSAADAIVSFAASDNVPRTILEAMACETPVIARDLPDLKGIVVDRRHALLVKGNADALAEKIKELKRDPALAAVLAKEGRVLVEARADIKKDTRAIIERYKQLMV